MRPATLVFALSFLLAAWPSGLTAPIHGPSSAILPDSLPTYFPAPERSSGWRRCTSDENVRKLAGFDPKLLDFAGAFHRGLYGGPWAIVVIRHGYLVREWYEVPSMPQTTFDVWSCTKSATGMAYGMLLDESRNHRLPHDARIDLDSAAYSFIPEGHPPFLRGIRSVIHASRRLSFVIFLR